MSDEKEYLPRPVVIEVCKRMDGETFHAQIRGMPGHWGAGKNWYEAVGSVVVSHYDVLGITTEYLPGVTR